MRRTTLTAGAVAAAGAMLLVGLAPASAETVESTISGGSLTATVSGAALAGVTLNGTAQTATGTTGEWTITDARGTGAQWNLSVSATDLTSAAGTVEATARTIPASALSIAPGAVTAGAGSDPATGITTSSVTLSSTSQALVSAAADHKGTYSVAASTFSLAVPANAYRSNYSGAVGSSALNPYVSTVTFTIG